MKKQEEGAGSCRQIGGIPVQSQGSTMGEKNKKDKEKPVKTTPRVTDGKTNVNKNNLNDIGNILLCWSMLTN